MKSYCWPEARTEGRAMMTAGTRIANIQAWVGEVFWPLLTSQRAVSDAEGATTSSVNAATRESSSASAYSAAICSMLTCPIHKWTQTQIQIKCYKPESVSNISEITDDVAKSPFYVTVS